MACDLAIDRGVVRSDGTLSVNFFALFNEAGNRFGKARIQKMMFTELAVSPYRLAPSAREVTRWDRCVAMSFAAYDALPPAVKQKAWPSRQTFFRRARRACTIGVHQGLIPESGAPSTQTLRVLMAEAAVEGASH